MDNFIPEKILMQDLQISRSTIFRYRTKMGLPHIKLGAKTFYNLKEVEDFLQKHSSWQYKISKTR